VVWLDNTAPMVPLVPPPAVEPKLPGFFDLTFRKGPLVRCTAVIMIAINYVLFVIGFLTAVYGLRLGSQEIAQMEFLQVRAKSACVCNGR